MGVYQTGQARPDWQQQMPQKQASDTDTAAASVPGFFDTVGAAYNAATDSTYAVQDYRLNNAYGALAQQLAAQTGKDEGNFWVAGQTDTKPAPSKIWNEINTRRALDPNFMKDIGVDQAEFEKRVVTRGGQYQIDQATAGRGNSIAGLIGSAGAAWHDPFQIGALFLGGPEVTVPARGIIMNGLARAGVSGLTNAAFAAAEEPLTVQARATMGEQTTPGDVATDIGGAALFGSALHVGIEAGAAAIKPVAAAGRDVFESGLAKAYSLMPDKVLADHFADKTAPWERTPTEQAALNVIGNQAQIDATNPFGASYAAMAVHQARVAEAGSALDRGAAPGGGPAFQAPPSGAISAGYYAKVRAAEDPTGSPTAHPATSSATGLYQFTNDTWLHLYKARFGSAGMTRDQILALRADPQMQETLMRDVTQANASALRRNNIPASDDNLYLAHFVGPEKAAELIHADPSTPIEHVLGTKAIEANAWLKGKTTGYVRAWAERKMGGKGFSAGGPPMPDIAADDGGAALAAQDAENASMDADEAAMPADQGPDMGATQTQGPAPVKAPAAPPEELPLSVQTLIPSVREMVGDRSMRLNDMDAMAAQLGANPEDVHAALTELVNRGELRQRSDTGAFMRHPQGSAGPEDVLTFLARHGGLRDDEGHNLGLKRIGAVGDALDGGAPAVATDMTKGGRAAMEARGRFGSKDWGRVMTPKGRLLRREGLSVDRAGELMHEAGYMVGERPTTAEVIDFLDKRISTGKRAFTLEDQARMGGDDEGGYRLPTRDEQIGYNREQIEQAGRTHFGMEPHEIDEEFLDHAASMMIDHSIEPKEAFMRAVNDFMDQARHEAMDEKDIPDYRNADYEWPDHPRSDGENLPNEEDFSRYRPVTSDEAAGGSGAETGRDNRGEGSSGPIDPSAYTEYDDPAGDRIAKAADSAWHDIEVEHMEPLSATAAAKDLYNQRYGQLWQMPAEELEKLRDAAKKVEADGLQKAIDLIGLTGADDLRARLETGTFDWEKIANQIEKRAEKQGLEITDEVDAILNPKWTDAGSGDLPMSEDVSAVLNAHYNMADDDEHMLAAEIGWALRKLDADKMREVLAGHASPDTQAQMATLRLGAERMKELGVASVDIPKRVVAAMVKNGVRESDAIELTRNGFEDMRAASEPKVAGPAPAAPTALAQPVALENHIDPAIAERDKQRAQLAAEAPLRKAAVAQEGTMGLGLFDATDQPVFDLSQGDAAAQIAAIKSALDADQAALDQINSCL